MADTGLKYGSSLANVSGIGTVDWSNPTNAAGNNTNDATRASAFLSGFGTASKYLTCVFAFGLVSGQTPVGIAAAVRRFSTLNDTDAPQDNAVRVTKNGAVGGSNLAAAGPWPQSGAWSSDYGGSSNLWGQSFAWNDTIGLAISAISNDPNDTVYVTSFRATCWYSEVTASGLVVLRRRFIEGEF